MTIFLSACLKTDVNSVDAIAATSIVATASKVFSELELSLFPPQAVPSLAFSEELLVVSFANAPWNAPTGAKTLATESGNLQAVEGAWLSQTLTRKVTLFVFVFFGDLLFTFGDEV